MGASRVYFLCAGKDSSTLEYPNLLSPGKIGTVELKNRVVMPAMVTGMANYDGTASEQIADYYEERAKNGVALIITGCVRVNDLHGATIPRQLSMTHDRHVEPFARAVERVHSHGAKIFCQLHHPGRQGLSGMCGAAPATELAGRLWPGFYGLLDRTMKLMGNNKKLTDWLIRYFRWPAVAAPSKVPSRLYNQRTRALRRFEIKALERDFVRAAKRVRRAGADGVELHAAHGYLIQQFLSPHTNRRTDEYGGSLENRMRFLLNIVEGVRRECGPDFAVIVRLTVDEFYRFIDKPGQGLLIDEGVEIARRLERAGADAIDVSSASYENNNYWLEPMSFEPGWRKHLARAVKDTVSIPVIAANVIRTPAQAEEQIAEGTQDFVALGRPLLADPGWVAKAASGSEDSITRCISCLRCIESLEDEGRMGFSMTCALNPRMGRERETADPPRDGRGRAVAVIGAGPSGMTAAAVLAARGFEVTVFEAGPVAGGQLNLAKRPPGKARIEWCIEDLQRAAERAGAVFRFGHAASLENLEELDPLAIVVATGGRPVVPDVPGVNRDNVHTVNEVLDGTVKIEGRRVAVIGSGMTGLETADRLAADGNNLLIVEMLKEIGPDIYFQNRYDVLERLREHHPTYLTRHRLVEIADGSITLENLKTKSLSRHPVDDVVLAVGVESENSLAGELRKRFSNVTVIGDARAPGRIHNAVHDAFELGL